MNTGLFVEKYGTGMYQNLSMLPGPNPVLSGLVR
jgi:hypothetical protein